MAAAGDDEAVTVAAVALREVGGAGDAIGPAVVGRGTRDGNAGGVGELNGATTGETGARRANGESAGAGEAVAATAGVPNDGNSW
jgi:hypothetical protein